MAGRSTRIAAAAWLVVALCLPMLVGCATGIRGPRRVTTLRSAVLGDYRVEFSREVKSSKLVVQLDAAQTALERRMREQGIDCSAPPTLQVLRLLGDCTFEHGTASASQREFVEDRGERSYGTWTLRGSEVLLSHVLFWGHPAEGALKLERLTVRPDGSLATTGALYVKLPPVVGGN